MRMAEYNLPWAKSFDELKEVDIDLAKLEDVAGLVLLEERRFDQREA